MQAFLKWSALRYSLLGTGIIVRSELALVTRF
jgi:hypothetical protein